MTPKSEGAHSPVSFRSDASKLRTDSRGEPPHIEALGVAPGVIPEMEPPGVGPGVGPRGAMTQVTASVRAYSASVHLGTGPKMIVAPKAWRVSRR